MNFQLEDGCCHAEKIPVIFLIQKKIDFALLYIIQTLHKILIKLNEICLYNDGHNLCSIVFFIASSYNPNDIKTDRSRSFSEEFKKKKVKCFLFFYNLTKDAIFTHIQNNYQLVTF